MREKEVLLWDWDDLLSGLSRVQEAAARKLIPDRALRDFRETLDERLLPHETEIVISSLGGSGEEFWKEVDILYRQFTPIPPGTRAVLEELACRWNMIAQGSAPRETVDLLLKEAHIHRHFQSSGGGEALVSGNPDPEFFLRALDSSGVSDDKAIIITGPSGASAAASSGIDYVFVPGPYTLSSNTLFQDTLFTVGSLEDLLRHL